jgi:hypothetical protein
MYRTIPETRSKSLITGSPDLGKRLHFVVSHAGFRCVELPNILAAAQDSVLTSAPNPSYTRTSIKVSPRVARVLLQCNRIPVEDAIRWGRLLREEIQTNLRTSSQHQSAPAPEVW